MKYELDFNLFYKYVYTVFLILKMFLPRYGALSALYLEPPSRLYYIRCISSIHLIVDAFYARV